MTNSDQNRKPSRGRGIARFANTTAPGTLAAVLDAASQRNPTPALLEIGSGEGVLLLDLMKAYPSFQLEGVNKKPWAAMLGSASLVASAVRHGIMSEEEIRARELPRIHFIDAGDLDFPDDSFDVILSQLAIPYVKRKDLLIGNVWRMLRPGGQALLNIDVSLREAPDFLPGESPRFLIHKDRADDQALQFVSFRDWIATRAALGFDATAYTHPHPRGRRIHLNLELRKNRSDPFPLDLQWDPNSSFNLHRLRSAKAHTRLWGYRSVFRLAQPH